MGNCYVYTLAYPDGTVFYVGKGSGNRILDHEAEAKQNKKSYKCNVIRQIWRDGGEVIRTKVQENMEEAAAYLLEIDLIRMYGREHLTNIADGGKGGVRKNEKDKQIVVSFSLSGETLQLFREVYALSEGHEPSLEECREKARDLAFQQIGAYIKQKIEIEGAVIL